MSECGRLLAIGRTSEVYAHGADDVVKVPRPGVPPHWARVEARIAEAVNRAGVPCPEVRGLVEVDGRESIVFERIDGPSLWQTMLDDPAGLTGHVATLVDLQRSIHRVGSLAPIPRLADRIGSKILAAEAPVAGASRSGMQHYHRKSEARPPLDKKNKLSIVP